jgi:hypothetical protein
VSASHGRPIGNKKAEALTHAALAIEKLNSSIMVCMTDAAIHAAKRAEQAALMEVVVAAWWTLVIERQDIKLNLECGGEEEKGGPGDASGRHKQHGHDVRHGARINAP